MIMLFGLVAKNGILLVDYANTMRHRGMRVVDDLGDGGVVDTGGGTAKNVARACSGGLKKRFRRHFRIDNFDALR